jgi:L-lactate dehydrogenase complex protein LldF
MQVASMHFKERAHVRLNDDVLQQNLQKIKSKFVANRRKAIVELDDFEGTRDAGKAIRNRALENLDVWLEVFERNAIARGATVLWAETPAEVNALVLDIATRHAVRKIIKSKSMVSEESALDHAIEAAGVTVVETDLGEYILQNQRLRGAVAHHRAGAAQVERGGVRPLPRKARHDTQDGDR